MTGMGAWNGVVRSWNLVNWTYGRNTGEGWHSGAVNRPGYGDGRLGPYNAWLSDNVPDYLRVNLDRENLPLWDGNNNDPDVCCGDSKHEFSPAYIVYGVSSQGATLVMGFFLPLFFVLLVVRPQIVVGSRQHLSEPPKPIGMGEQQQYWALPRHAAAIPKLLLLKPRPVWCILPGNALHSLVVLPQVRPPLAVAHPQCHLNASVS